MYSCNLQTTLVLEGAWKLLKPTDYLIQLVKRQGIDPIISMLTPRNDKHGQKVKVVNEKLRNLCVKYNVGYIEHDNINTDHLNPGGIHLANKYKYLFSDNLTNYFNYILLNGSY